MSTPSSPLRARVFALAAGITFALALACGAPQSYTLRQSSFVPAPAAPPPVNTDRRADMYTAVEAVSVGTEPSLAPNASAGLWVPRTQIEGALSLRVHKRVTVRAPYLYAPASSASPASSDVVSNPGIDAYGAGLGAAVRMWGFESPVSLDASLDFLGISVPTYYTLTDTSGTVTSTGSSTNMVAMVMLGTALNVRATDWLTLSATASVRNHPSNVAVQTVTYVGTGNEGAEFGPWVAVVGASAEVRLWSWFSLVGQVQWAVSDFPVRYGPTLVLGARTPFGDVPGTRQSRARYRGELPGPMPPPVSEPVGEEQQLSPVPIAP